MSTLADLQQIETDFNALHTQYRAIVSNLPLAAADALDTDTVSSIIAEGVFFRYFTLWEQSVEKAFVHFCTSGPSLTGSQPVCRLTNCDNASVRKILVNGQRYLDWSDQKTVRDRALLFFENGMPFHMPLSGSAHLLTDFEKLRNVIAHDSVESWTGYLAVQRNNFNTERTFRFLPGQMLRVRSRTPTKTWAEHYFDEVSNCFAAILRP